MSEKESRNGNLMRLSDTGGISAAGIVDTCATSVVETDGKFAAGIVDTGGKFAIGINDASETSGKICRRCR